MEFLLLVEDRRDEAPRAAVGVEEMGKFALQLAEQGVLRDAAGPLRPEAEGARVRVRGGAAVVTDGPFAEGREVVGGYFVVEVPDRAAAIELAKRCPYARAGVIEVRVMQCGPRGEGSGGQRFMLLYLWGPEPPGSDDPRCAEMRHFTEQLARQGKVTGGGRLPTEIPPAQVEIRGARTIVTDGPFAETKEIIAGFALIEAADRAEAIEIAKRVPHARWDTVVVREVGRMGAP
ncbi:MAG TPA: YciI family protein [Myxococcota bacterium]|nr:YciI family protein [Myxococcota bacterium]